ncbi:MAG: glycine betaine/L-proline ABC transporter ATP-binding protein [bacterium]|nr:glycine betaine/L-proline ABC transporter ATP-binding protein [bacterium]MDE0417795.1 glycine betaine/L-proline ABC transporter ATP-binding protein [bacterium]
MADPNDAIVLRHVYKIFGDSAQAALRAIRERGLTKDQVLDQFGCVVGVADANITVSRGEIFCVMGLSGSGKSTLVRHINRLLEPTSGEVIVDGENVMTKTPAELRELRSRKIGMVFQNFALLPHRTVRDNVALPMEIQGVTKHRRYGIAEQALAMVGLDGWGDRYCDELSGGMQQRVGLARAIAADPVFLLMDEPFSALDPLIRRQLQSDFMELSRRLGKTTVFITHDLDEAIRIGNRIAIMKDGEIVQTGRAEEIVTNPKDDYVADFVAHISRLNLLHARSLMEPIDVFASRTGTRPDVGDLPKVGNDSLLSEIIDVAAETDQPILVTDENAIPVGIIDKRTLLRGIKGSA